MNQTEWTTPDPCAVNDTYEFVFYLFIFGLAPIVLAGLFMNLLCILVFHRQRSQLTSVYILKLLAICDLVFLVVCAIHFPFRHVFVLLTDHLAIFTHSDNQIEPLTYYITIPWYFMILQTRNWLVVLVSTERFLNLVYPMWARTQLTKRKMNITCLLIFVISILTHIPRYWGQYLVPYSDPCPAISQTLKISYHDWEGMYDKIIYMAANVFLPLILLYILNIGLILALRRAQRLRRELTQKSHNDRKEFKAQVQATIMVISVVLIFTICETPVVFDRVGQMIATFNDDNKFLNYARKMGLILVALDSTINFIAYVIANQKFRRGLHKLFCRKIKKQNSWLTSDDGGTIRRTVISVDSLNNLSRTNSTCPIHSETETETGESNTAFHSEENISTLSTQNEVTRL